MSLLILKISTLLIVNWSGGSILKIFPKSAISFAITIAPDVAVTLLTICFCAPFYIMFSEHSALFIKVGMPKEYW